MNKEHILNDVENKNIQVIAFDIFDTIIHRTVSPDHVHRIWAKSVIDYYELKMNVNELVRMKLNARRIGKLKNIRKGLDKECKYEQMTKELYKKLKIQETYKEFHNRCIVFETDIEVQVCYIDQKFLELYSQLLYMDKKIIFISDFYLPGSALCKLLNLKGLELQEKQIYSSSDFCRTKITGNLYTCVLDRLKVNPNHLLMIGDSKISDYQNSQLKGLHSYHVDSSQYYNKYEFFEKEFKKNRNSLKIFLKKDWVKDRETPFSHVAFCMFAFVDNLYKQLHRENRKNVFFLSREGELFKRLFDLYQEMVILDEKKRVNTHYLKVSRHSTLIPSIFDIKKDSFAEIYKNYPDLTLETFFKNLGLAGNEAINEEFQDILVSNRLISDFKNSIEYERVIESKVFQRECTLHSRNQRELFVQYLDSFNVNYQSDGLCIVDIGYSGTTQENIRKVFSNEIPIYGYYMFSYANPETINSMNQKVGILYDKNNKKRKKDYFAYNSAVLEMISLASHGSIDEYIAEGEKVVPTYNHIESEESAYREIVLPMQKNIEAAMKEICTTYSQSLIVNKDYYRSFLKQYRSFIFDPKMEEMYMYAKIPFVDNFAAYVTYDDFRENDQSVFGNILNLVFSGGRLIRKQNTHWIAVALNRLKLNFFNPLLYIFAPVSLAMFDLLELLEKRKKGISS
ncbi:hypothetical protein IHQ11_15130 [Priestia megaterium]|uniref:hypothetical protein n=1 Tax=Priestia megaterium TaxID=1404 RepID=UPI001B39E1E0|nr:hypothetical protein [Priestia megaterium]MBQ4867831.1 hypothetical protein [Priestia megaterium]